MQKASWHLITGEYAPALGGVAGYSRSVARALADAGDEVHVWAPSAGPLTPDPGVRLHPLPSGYAPPALLPLSRLLARERGPKRLLVQYVPQAFGVKGMNIPFCLWLAAMRDAEVWVMFHEVAVPWGPLRVWKQNTIAAANRVMASLLMARADRVFMSVPRWESALRPLSPRWPGATWLPIPSNVPTSAPAEAVRTARSGLPLREGWRAIGHFGSYGPHVAPLVERTLSHLLLADPKRIAVLIGRGGETVASALRRDRLIADRVVATGVLDVHDIASHLLACDVLAQPLPDGVSSRRTSVMAGLALGIPTATNTGSCTETVWAGSVELASSPESVAAATEALLRDPQRAAKIAGSGRELYWREFSLDRTVRTLRAESEPTVA